MLSLDRIVVLAGSNRTELVGAKGTLFEVVVADGISPSVGAAYPSLPNTFVSHSSYTKTFPQGWRLRVTPCSAAF